MNDLTDKVIDRPIDYEKLIDSMIKTNIEDIWSVLSLAEYLNNMYIVKCKDLLSETENGYWDFDYIKAANEDIHGLLIYGLFKTFNSLHINYDESSIQQKLKKIGIEMDTFRSVIFVKTWNAWRISQIINKAFVFLAESQLNIQQYERIRMMPIDCFTTITLYFYNQIRKPVTLPVE